MGRARGVFINEYRNGGNICDIINNDIHTINTDLLKDLNLFWYV